MASKGPRSRLDHESRAKRQKALEAPKEPRRPKTHWDHLLEEMVWLSKDFESERKWKLAQAKKVAVRASKCLLDQSTKGERKVKEEEQRLRKVALGISKEIKKFWMKIEKLILYKHQLEVEERKKKTLDKQLDFLLGQTERYSTMLAKNLVDKSFPKELCDGSGNGHSSDFRIDDDVPQADMDKDYTVHSEDECGDDERTIEEDEALITEEERREELAALQDEMDLPLEELLQRYTSYNESGGDSVDLDGLTNIKDAIIRPVGSYSTNYDTRESDVHVDMTTDVTHCQRDESIYLCEVDAMDSAGEKLTMETVPGENAFMPLDVGDEVDDMDYTFAAEEEKDDETTLSEEEELALKESSNPLDEIKFLQYESEIPLEDILARYEKDAQSIDNDSEGESECGSLSSDDMNMASPYVAVEHEPSKPHTNSEVNCSDIQVGTDMDIDDDLAKGMGTENIIADAAAAARSAQPTGNTFSTTEVRTKFPFLLKFPLREYQHIGLDWLVTMYEKRLNGILADEMGLGKTIMTISLLAHLACEKGIWGPHLIVVPTSVMLNWETEFLKWCPAFKILTYFGSAKERKNKRQGWLKPGSFHICITTYRLVIQDSKVFKRKKWKYLILDEAHLIKNWKSQRWQTLLNFNSKRRILLTGTPLQNDLMELWSLMHFLMPHIFQSHQEFKDWFSNPITGMVEGQEKVNKDVVDRLHNVLRPFILRRLKRDVEKQLPTKHEHVLSCRLSRRQRNLYEDFIASSETQTTLASGSFFGMISVIMQLRKVCNHPDLFEGRPIISSFDLPGIDIQLSSAVCNVLNSDLFSTVDLRELNIVFTQSDFSMTSWEVDEVQKILLLPRSVEEKNRGSGDILASSNSSERTFYKGRTLVNSIFADIQKTLCEERRRQAEERADAIAWWNSLRCEKRPVYGTDLRKLVSLKHHTFDITELKNNPLSYMNFSSKLADAVLSPVERLEMMLDVIEHFMFAIPVARAPTPFCWCRKLNSPVFLHPSFTEECTNAFSPLLTPLRPAVVRRQVYFPDRRLIQFDCGKLQELAVLLRRLKSEGHRALIFTQMTKMLDILEAFINLYGYTYMRLDGSTQPEERQTLMQRFNTNPRYFLFILSTRSGGVGINLVGADTVIFYDSDWNPAMDQQAQDRCHRIGQTREVHIYRLISESTIEENILKKANQKRALDDLVIQSGGYNTEFFKKLDPMELFSGHRSLHAGGMKKGSSIAFEGSDDDVVVFSNDDVEAALKHAEDEADYMALKKVEQEEAVENQEFTEEALGRTEEEDIANDDDNKPEDIVITEQGCFNSVSSNPTLYEMNMSEDKVLTVAEPEEDIDMLADVKQMAAAAAAAGQASSSFESQLRPVDRYAMRFLDFWDPIIDKSKIENEVDVEEREWELDRIQKFKEEMEAEIDEDEEPLVYETWDADLATEAYKQHVEALIQQQLLEEVEYEARMKDEVDYGYLDASRVERTVERRPKSKKLKKMKLKSLKKGPLVLEKELTYEEPEELEMDFDTNEDNVYSLEGSYHCSSFTSSGRKKRRLVASEEERLLKKPKMLKKVPESILVADSDISNKHHLETNDFKYAEGTSDYERLANRNRLGGKLSITTMPLKHVMVIKREKFKKGNIWSKDCAPTPDAWASQEDAILCAVVHEYGANWSLVSDVLYGMTAGGFYRGRFRHPVHCCDRFRELFFRYILSAHEIPNAEKISAYTSGKALLKATEDNVHVLLYMASDLPDMELLLQKHFIALLSSAWHFKILSEHQNLSSSRSVIPSCRGISPNSQNKPGKFVDRMHSKTLGKCSKIVATALADASTPEVHQNEGQVPPNRSNILPEVDTSEVILEFPEELVESALSFPVAVTLSACTLDLLQTSTEPQGEYPPLNITHLSAEKKFRLAWETCLDSETPGWAAAFASSGTGRPRLSSKSQASGKQKCLLELSKPQKSKLPRNMEADDTRPSWAFTFSEFKMDDPLASDVANNGQDCFLLEDADPQDLSTKELYDDDPDFSSGLCLDSFSLDLESLSNISEFG